MRSACRHGQVSGEPLVFSYSPPMAATGTSALSLRKGAKPVYSHELIASQRPLTSDHISWAHRMCTGLKPRAPPLQGVQSPS